MERYDIQIYNIATIKGAMKIWVYAVHKMGWILHKMITAEGRDKSAQEMVLSHSWHSAYTSFVLTVLHALWQNQAWFKRSCLLLFQMALFDSLQWLEYIFTSIVLFSR